MTASVWNPGTTPLVSADSSIQFQRFVATAAQEVFTLTSFEYVVGVNSLLVFKNGQILALESDFEEIDSESFSLVVPASLNDIIYAVGFVEITNAQAITEEAIAAALAFNKIYLGAKTTEPILDNQGESLQDGAMYFNTTTNVMNVYDLGTTSWIATSTAEGTSLLKAANLSDVASMTTTRDNLGVRVKSTTIVFDTQRVAKVSLVDAQVLTTSKLKARVVSKVGDSLGDELEMDYFVVNPICLVDGTIIFRCNCVTGVASGTYNIEYVIQN